MGMAIFYIYIYIIWYNRNLVPISSKENNTTIMQPVLAMTWGSSIVFIKATPKMSDCTVSPLKRQYDSDVPIVAISWMSDHVVMALDTNVSVLSQ